MKLKQYLILGIGMVAGFGISIAGLAHVSQAKGKKVHFITSEKAKSIMLNKIPGATISEFSYDEDDRIPKFDGTLVKDNYEYEIDINAKTGEIIKFEKEKISISNNSNNLNVVNNSLENNQQSTTKPSSTQNNINNNTNSYIGEEKAKSIMLSKVPGATIREFHFDNDRTSEYEAELVKDDYEYDISVDAKTGSIRELSREHKDSYKDDDHDDYNDHDDDDRYDD